MAEGDPFELRGVAHLIQPWGTPARDLDQLRDGIASAPVEVLFNHTVQYQLRHSGANELPPDDFSAWVGGVVQDAETAERLSFAAQSRNTSVASVRVALLEVLNLLSEGRRRARDAPEESAFLFLSATSVNFSTGTFVGDGQELVETLLEADPGVWFYHLVEERWFREGHASLVDWLLTTRDHRLASRLVDAADSGLPIEKARAQLHRRWRQSRIARQVTEAAASPEDARREAGRQAVARLVRRVTRPDESS
jgi:hypothetical protein